MQSPENTSALTSIHSFINNGFRLHSRVHKLNSFRTACNVFVKRDDELSSGITGSKYRKIASLLPYILQNSFDEILMIGSAQSNNISALLQVLNENKIPAKLMLLESNENDLKGNLLWMHLLQDMKTVTWVSRAEWPTVNEKARQYAEQQHIIGRKIFIVEEGSSVTQAIPGAMSLAEDVLRNEQETNLEFDHIFIDSGSGTSAIGLLYGLALAGRKPDIYITLIAGTEDEFMAKYTKLVKESAAIYKLPEKYFECKIHFSRSLISPSFGSVTQQVLAEVKKLAEEEGILAEPIYTAKHFYTAREIISTQNLAGNILIINSGGSFGLSGFQEKLSKIITA